ncbi:small ubiquitin-related modifier 1-like [Herrania umbratica]|uniref:Small ubiquitin-related modifier 1-like n=1 Tax=Herrania umbratica TaxID=108875 RepID=A0A6J1AUN0_9ROSI|nr:small ubiquitin-related modifier 1-like [Herrania umbratica]
MESNRAGDQSSSISLIVISQDGNEVHVKIRRGPKIKKLLTAYCHRHFLNYNTVQFLIGGCPFADNKTPEVFDKSWIGRWG